MATIKRQGRRDSGDAFLKEGAHHTRDDLAEGLAEDFISSATTGEAQGEESHEAIAPEEDGGPFVPSRGKVEFARGYDGSNPRGAEREAFPTPSSTGKR
ncbi:MAG: hypothetical protein ABI175_25900 [Polyangiales bacterium]